MRSLHERHDPAHRTQARQGARDLPCCRAKTLGAEACPLPIFDRATVETPALELFETEALSYADTRAHVAAQLDTRIADATTHAARASREAAELRTQADRITRDYRAGTRDAGLHSELRASVAEELTAAEAQAERLAAHAEKTRASGPTWTRRP